MFSAVDFEKIVRELKTLLTVGPTKRKNFFLNNIDPEYKKLKRIHENFMTQFEDIERAAVKVISSSNIELSGVEDSIQCMDENLNRLIMARRMSMHERREVYENARVLRDFPSFEQSFMTVLSKEQKAALSDFMNSVAQYFETEGRYEHDLIKCLKHLEWLCAASRLERDVSGQETNDIKGILTEIDIFRTSATEKWALVS